MRTCEINMLPRCIGFGLFCFPPPTCLPHVASTSWHGPRAHPRRPRRPRRPTLPRSSRRSQRTTPTRRCLRPSRTEPPRSTSTTTGSSTARSGASPSRCWPARRRCSLGCGKSTPRLRHTTAYTPVGLREILQKRLFTASGDVNPLTLPRQGAASGQALRLVNGKAVSVGAQVIAGDY